MRPTKDVWISSNVYRVFKCVGRQAKIPRMRGEALKLSHIDSAHQSKEDGEAEDRGKSKFFPRWCADVDKYQHPQRTLSCARVWAGVLAFFSLPHSLLILTSRSPRLREFCQAVACLKHFLALVRTTLKLARLLINVLFKRPYNGVLSGRGRFSRQPLPLLVQKAAFIHPDHWISPPYPR